MTVDKLEAARTREVRWAEDERRALQVYVSDERPDYPLWVSVIGGCCVLVAIVVSLYLIAAGIGL